MKSVLRVLDLSVEFETRAGRVRVLDNVALELAAGETLALVGESGSGKTLTALAVLGLLPRGATVVSGRAFLGERNLLRLSERELRPLRGPALGIVFQDPLAALHPMLTLERQLTEGLEVHEGLTRRAARTRARTALEEVGLPERVLDCHPHELSGGMRQRVALAQALLLRPAVLFADEITTALDATLQGQVLALLAELQRRHGTAVVLISHDLARVSTVADRVQVLYSGRTVEVARTAELFRRPLHPYTAGLLASTPRLDGALAFPLAAIPGQQPEPAHRPSGCAFHPRCALVQDGCRARRPELEEVRGQRERRSACLEVERLLEARA